MFVSSTDQSPSSSSPTKSTDELGQLHLSTFSIRDYAFSYRTKNFKKSWPFSTTGLQLCLKHGLSDPLPPIQTHEPLSLEKPSITRVETISYKTKSEKLGSNQPLVKTKEGYENGLASGLKSKIQVAITNKNPGKKIGLIVKPGACMDSGSKEDRSCLFASSESMGLRTCPICKTFSSVSNTTLNAHMDQCLSVDSGQQPSRPKVKARVKVKSMIDIYATAKRCTLEDLDKRNGTNWAMVSSYSKRFVCDNKPEVSSKGKKRSVLRVGVDEDASGIGPVYIDGKGQKLRILSEFSSKASDPLREHEDGNEKKSSSEDKGSKKLIVCKGNASKVPESRRGNSEKGRGMKRSETPDPIFNQRMLTKHCLSRYRNQKGINDRVLWDQPSENGHSLSGDSLVSRGSSHVSADLSETLSSPLKSQNSRRICGENQVSLKSWALSRTKSTTTPSFVSEVKLKKARLDFSENEDDDEDTGKWESEMTQECELTDNDYESYEETVNNKGDKTDDEFESLIYEKTGCENLEQGSSFMEVDPIPIPGPPGSFLPRLWDMGTDAIGNPSVITSQVQSSQDKLDLTDRNLSESPVSAISNFAAQETHSFHNIINNDKRPCGVKDNNGQSCCYQRKEKAFEGTTYGGSPPHMIQQDLDFQSKSVPVLRLMGKDLMVIEPLHDESTLKPTSQFLDLSKTQQVAPSLHRPYGGNGLSFGTSTSFY